MFFFYFFFFSSRRRHTRCGRDWSSDVCSSDLEKIGYKQNTAALQVARHWLRIRGRFHGHQRISLTRVISCGLRSEEHTSELQSRPHLVCRLLLEKKKHNHSLHT